MKLNLRSETAAAVVAGASFIASAGHIVKVVAETNALLLALVYPVGIDGLIYVGIRALQSGRRVAGTFALLIGGFYSLAFNAHAEGALHMPKLLIAASMPVCMMVAFVIEATGRKAEPVEEPAAPAAPIETEWDRMQERVEMRLRAEHALHVEEMKAEFAAKFEALRPVEAAPVSAAVVAPASRPAITDGRKAGGRVETRDVEQAVEIMRDEDGRTNEEIASIVGTNAKAVQRPRRAYVLITTTDKTDEEINEDMKNSISVAHIARVRAAA